MAYIYQSDAWAAYDSKKYEVNTTTFTTYPFTIKSPTTPVSATIYGNMEQNGTPTPTNPIQPAECGDLVIEGEHTGQYKIPILSNSITTNVYLGEVQTTRKVKKLVLTGEEQINTHPTISSWFQIYLTDIVIDNVELCTHYKPSPFTVTSIQNGEILVIKQTSIDAGRIIIKDTAYTTAEDFKTFLQQQYTAETPVTVWYVFAEPTTSILNEPIRKIGDYADSVTSSIPVTINSDTVDVSTTLKPSAVAAPSLSWGTGDDYMYSSGAWS